MIADCGAIIKIFAQLGMWYTERIEGNLIDVLPIPLD